MSVTSATPTSSVSQAAAAAGTATGPAQVVVVQVLGAYGGDAVRNGLVQTLQDAAGPGSIVTGTVTDVRADGTFALQTKAGPELVLHHPPELPLTVGSAVAVRIVSISPTPQVAVLTVDGKLVSSQLTGTVVPPQPGTPPAPATMVPPLAAGTLPVLPATLASTLFAAISLEDEVAIEAALSGDGGVTSLATQAAGDVVQADAQSVIATLLRPAPARLGSAPIAAGTRYLATLSIGTVESEPADTIDARNPLGTVPPTPVDSDEPANLPTDNGTEGAADPAAPTLPQPPATAGTAPTAQPLDLANFTALTTVLAGRVLPTSSDSETLVETAVGTLSIPVQDMPPATGAAIQLKITAVAPPVSSEKPALPKTPVEDARQGQPALQDAAQILAPIAPALAQQIQAQLSLQPSDHLASLILNFLGGLKMGPPPLRWPDPPIRKALVDAGRSDVATRLDTDASQIGQTRPAPPGDWSITILPYLGLATTKPMRLYRRTPGEEEREKGGGERFVIELQLVRLGAMQLDGLVRERRFDLVLRSEKSLDDGLRALVERTFRDSLLISGWSGEISYARTGAVPLIPLQPDGGAVGLSA
ncbi:MAG TPA: hypothetical protein VGV37_05880 [Aliidongia sp.]|uniref:hypothetical protein n=1 Tax=Aliidongia sp. TaxID=1914230 RepID=UPI002DDC96BC|nr:hypothetical protein [Aliidongia sp.]HEV2674052.1 hypothetical protein [Aliidongia sp.]